MSMIHPAYSLVSWIAKASRHSVGVYPKAPEHAHQAKLADRRLRLSG